MADSEKLTALKKAYADIILNTAKEAAARIMVSERKAQRYQRELFAAKDESLRMLLRLKQMFDSKVNEAEMTSLSQQRRIEELEAQLGEAEDIVKDLRAELRELQDELEKMTSSQKNPLSACNSVGENAALITATEENGHIERNSEGENATPVTAMEENRLSTSGSESVISSLPPLQCNSVITLETKNSNLNRACGGNRCYNENDCHKDNCFACNPDFASIVMRRKEPELYRNGCTQRIRAFERNLLDENLSLSGQSDGVKNQIFIGEDEEDKGLCKQPVAKVDKFFDVERIEDLVKDAEAVNGIRKRRKKRITYHSLQGGDVKNQMFIKEEDNHICKNSIAKAVISSDLMRSHLLDDNLSLSGQSDGVKNQIFIGEDEEDKGLCKQPVAKVDKFFDAERIEDLVKDAEAVNGIRKRRRKRITYHSLQGGDVKSQMFIKEEDNHICKNSIAKAVISSDLMRSPVVVKNDGGIPRGIRRKRAARYKKNREYKNFPTFPHQAVDNNVQTREDFGTIDTISEEDPEPFVEPKSPSNAHEVIRQSGSEEVIKGETGFGRTCSFQSAPNVDKLSLNELELTRQDAVSAFSSEFPTCKRDFEVGSVLLSNSDLKELGANETAPVQPVDNKFLKYTFQRKRKKEFPSSSDGESFLGNGTLRRKMVEKQSDSVELHKSDIITESSRDNRRLAQVARQLISLSEKKWR